MIAHAVRLTLRYQVMAIQHCVGKHAVCAVMEVSFAACMRSFAAAHAILCL